MRSQAGKARQREAQRRWKASKAGQKSQRRYRQSEGNKAAQNRYRLSNKGKTARIQANRNYNTTNPERRKVMNKLNEAIRRGRLTRQPCEVCGEIKVHAHHDDYSLPLDVRWLCAKHHVRQHLETARQ